MSETVRDVLTWAKEALLERPRTAYFEGGVEQALQMVESRIGDYHIINGGLVSPETVERCARALCDQHDEVAPIDGERSWPRLTDDSRQLYREQALAVLEAAGYEQWDEVVTGVVLKNGEWIPEGPSMLGRGYGHGERVTIAIKRKEE